MTADMPGENGVTIPDMRDRAAAAASLRPFFRPRSVAVVGASRDPLSIGWRLLDALVANRFQGPVYPVNPKAAEIGGIRAYQTVRDLTDGGRLPMLDQSASCQLRGPPLTA